MVREIRVAHDDFADLVLGDQLLEFVLRSDRDPVRVVRPAQRRWIRALIDVGDLGGGDGDDLDVRVVAEDDVEVVEIASTGTEDENPLACHRCLELVRGPTAERCVGPGLIDTWSDHIGTISTVH